MVLKGMLRSQVWLLSMVFLLSGFSYSSQITLPCDAQGQYQTLQVLNFTHGDVWVTLEACLKAFCDPKQEAVFDTDKGFKYEISGGKFDKFRLDNSASSEKRACEFPFPETCSVVVRKGEERDFDLALLSYFTFLKIPNTLRSSASLYVNDGGLRLLLGLPAIPKDLFSQVSLFRKYFPEFSDESVERIWRYLNQERSLTTSVKHGENELVVSLTTWPARIHTVWLTLESISRQTLKPNRVVLWLADSQFPDHQLPPIIQLYQKLGLDVRYCDDLKGAKKLIPALQEFPSAVTITLDDDIIYDDSLFDRMFDAHRNAPGVIFANRARALRLSKDSLSIAPYMQWPLMENSSDIPASVVFPTGAGGVLYPPGCLSRKIFEVDTLKRLSLNADDVWFFAMSFMRGTPISMLNPLVPIQIEDEEHVKSSALFRQNKQKVDGNDQHINAVFSHFELFDSLKQQYLHKASFRELTPEASKGNLRALTQRFAAPFVDATYLDESLADLVSFIKQRKLGYLFNSCVYLSGSAGHKMHKVGTVLSSDAQKVIGMMTRKFCAPNEFEFLVFLGTYQQIKSRLKPDELKQFRDLCKKYPVVFVCCDPSSLDFLEKINNYMLPIFVNYLDYTGISYQAEIMNKKVLLALANAFFSSKVKQPAAKLKILESDQLPVLNQNLYGVADASHIARGQALSERFKASLGQQPSASQFIDKIQKTTIRVWLTNSDDPTEVPAKTLANYEASLAFYQGEGYKHTFWCLDKTKIPQTVSKLESLGVEVHEVKEIQSRFLCNPLTNKLLRDGLYGFASNIIRKEILHIIGGVYQDIGLKQQRSIVPTLRSAQAVFYVNEREFIDVCLMGFPAGSSFLKRELDFIAKLKEIDSKILRLYRSEQFPQGWTTTRSLYLTLLSGDWPDVHCVRQNDEFEYNGLRLWNTSPQYEVLRRDDNYFYTGY